MTIFLRAVFREDLTGSGFGIQADAQVAGQSSYARAVNLATVRAFEDINVFEDDSKEPVKGARILFDNGNMLIVTTTTGATFSAEFERGIGSGKGIFGIV